MKLLLITAALSAAALPAAAGSFTPQSYVKAALESSPVMMKADQALKQAEDVYRSAVLDAALPQLSAGFSLPVYDDARPLVRLDRHEVASYLAASWNLYDSASGPAYKLKTAKYDYDNAQLGYLVTKQAEALKALNRFYSLYAAQRRIGTAKTNLVSRERQYKDTAEQFQSGTRSRIEVTQSEGDKLQSELSLAQAESAAAKALMAFNELINAEPDAAQEVAVDTNTAAAVKLPLPRSDVDAALKNNYGLKRQRLALDRTRLENRSGVLANYPRFRVDASWRKNGLGLLGTPGYGGPGNPAYGVTASLNYAFGFFGLQNRLEIRAKAAALRSSELELQDAERQLKTGVLTSQADIALQVKSKQLLEFQVKAQKEAIDNLLTEYSLGGASFLQLDSAQTKYLDSSNGQIAAANDLELALANYRALLGEKIWE